MYHMYHMYYLCIIILCIECTLLPTPQLRRRLVLTVVIGAHDGILPFDGYNSDITDMSIKTRAGQDIGLEMMLDLTLEWTRSEVRS